VNGVNGSISNLFTNSFSNETTLNYKKTFKKDHTITGLGLFAINSNNTNTKGYAGRLLPNENLGMDGLEEGLAFNPVSSSSVNTMASYAGRLDYNYKSKYIVTGTFRADGSSKFREHWGYFPGAAGRKICARIVPVGVSKSATSLSLIIIVFPCCYKKCIFTLFLKKGYVNSTLTCGTRLLYRRNILKKPITKKQSLFVKTNCF
jgi:hypothetical protein